MQRSLPILISFALVAAWWVTAAAHGMFGSAGHSFGLEGIESHGSGSFQNPAAPSVLWMAPFFSGTMLASELYRLCLRT
jgi:hypothetical protein